MSGWLGARLRAAWRWFRTTRGTLWTFCVCSVLATFVAVLPALDHFRGLHDVSTAMRERIGPMIVDVQAARNALISANETAVAAFSDVGGRLTGPGQEYYNQMAIASQSLAQAAEVNAVGRPGTEALQTVEGLLASYSDLISQAGAHFRAEDELMGTVALWNAWRQLHDPHGGIIAKLGELRALQAEELGDQVQAGGATAGSMPWWVWLAGLFLLLAAAHVFIVRRFRRRLGGLVLASIAVVVLGVAVHDAVERTGADIRDFDAELRGVLAEPDGRMTAHLTIAARADRFCRSADGGCGPTLSARLRQAVPGVPHLATNRVVSADLEAAAPGAWLETAIAGSAVVIAGLAVAGFWPRLDEYSFGKR